MFYVALVLGTWVALMGVLGLVSPVRMIGLVRRIETPGALVLVAGLRLLMGVSLLLAAPASKVPHAITAFGVVAIVSGILTLALGVDRTRKWVEAWTAKPTGFVRAWGLVALVIGLWLVWALLP